MKEEAFLTWVKTTSGEEPIVTIEKRPRPKTTAGKDEQGEVIRKDAFIGWDGETVDFAPREFLPATVHHQDVAAGWEAELVIGPDGKPAYVNLTPLRRGAE